MAEQGTIISGDNAGGLIKAATPSPVTYDASAVKSGRMPQKHDTVCFERAKPTDTVATDVRVGTCAVANLAQTLQHTFHENAGDLTLGHAAHAEIDRLANQRAVRVLKPIPGADALPEELLAARVALAQATMFLLAVEVRMLEGDISAETLRAVLRQQRPTLPR